MAFDEYVLRAEVAREFGLGQEKYVPAGDEALLEGFHVQGWNKPTTAEQAERNRRQWEKTKKDPMRLEERRAQKRDCARRRHAKDKGIASVVMSDGSLWVNPEVLQ